MRRGGVDGLPHPRGGAVTAAVVRCTQVRTALGHLARDDDSPIRVLDGAAPVSRRPVLAVPVPGPLPDVADHVEQAVTVGRIATDRCGPLVPVGSGVPDRKFALPGVGEMPAARGELGTPGVRLPVQAAPGGVFPFGFGGQGLAGPGGVRADVVPGHVHHGVVEQPPESGRRPLRVPPVRARNPPPPLVGIAQVHRMRRGDEHGRPGHQRFGAGARILRRVGLPLGHGDVSGAADERRELPVGHAVPVDPETVHHDLVRRRLLRIVLVGAHPEPPAGDPRHVGCGRPGRAGLAPRGRGHAAGRRADVSRVWRLKFCQAPTPATPADRNCPHRRRSVSRGASSRSAT